MNKLTKLLTSSFIGVFICCSTLGCNHDKKDEPAKVEKTRTLSMNFYYTDRVLGYNPNAYLLYENRKIGDGFTNYIEPISRVAGDVLVYKFDGEVDDEIFYWSGDENFPSINITGYISSKVIKTEIIEFVPEEGTIKDNIELLNSLYEIESINDVQYVVEKKNPSSYKWVRLDEYEGDKLYITLDYKQMHLNYSGEYVEFNGPKPIVAGLYTSSPRKY